MTRVVNLQEYLHDNFGWKKQIQNNLNNTKNNYVSLDSWIRYKLICE